MDIQRVNGTLSIGGVRELSAANARSFQHETEAALCPKLDEIVIDLSETNFVDSSGLGALVWLFKAANRRKAEGGVTMRVIHPQPPVQQLLELTRMHHLFEIVPPPDVAADAGKGGCS